MRRLIAALAAIALVAFPALAQTQQSGPWTMLALGEDGANLTVQPSGCYLDLQCRTFTLACASGGLALSVRNLEADEAERWTANGGTASLNVGDAELTFAVDGIAEDHVWNWVAHLTPADDSASWLASLQDGGTVTLATPLYAFSFEPTQADVWQIAAFAEACLGTATETACPLDAAIYVGDAGTVAFTLGDPPTLRYATPDGTTMMAVHGDGHGRGANFYDRTDDRAYGYWFNGTEGEIGSTTAAEAPLTFTLETIGDFIRTCP